MSGRQSRVPTAADAAIMIAEARKALWIMVGFIAVIWMVQIFNAISNYQLSNDYGIRARDVSSLPDILTAPFLHFNWSHIEGNSGPLFIFGFLAAYRGVRKFFAVTALIVVVAGIGAWATNDAHSVAVGASGVVFGYFGYIIVRGIFDRHLIDIVLGLVMALSFAYQFSVLLPTAGIDWQGHAFGFAAGLICGWVFRDRRPKVAVPTEAAPVLAPTATIPTEPAPPPAPETPAAAPKVDPTDRIAQLRRELGQSGQ
jgi:membrane associated rhomboid family serine protease